MGWDLGKKLVKLAGIILALVVAAVVLLVVAWFMWENGMAFRGFVVEKWPAADWLFQQVEQYSHLVLAGLTGVLGIIGTGVGALIWHKRGVSDLKGQISSLQAEKASLDRAQANDLTVPSQPVGSSNMRRISDAKEAVVGVSKDVEAQLRETFKDRPKELNDLLAKLRRGA